MRNSIFVALIALGFAMAPVSADAILVMTLDDPDTFDIAAPGVVVAGHGVASGEGDSAPYPGGSIAQQLPFFAEAGLDLSGYHLGTLNVDLAPAVFVPVAAPITIHEVRWTEAIPPETFSFIPCRLDTESDSQVGLIYRPHPETKVEHEQPASVVEILAPWTRGAEVGSVVRVSWSRAHARTD